MTAPSPSPETWLARWAEAGAAGRPLSGEGLPGWTRGLMGALVRSWMGEAGIPAGGWAPALLEHRPTPVPVPPLPPGLRRPELLGLAYEALIGADQRRQRGSHFTPPRAAEGLCRLALDGDLVSGAGAGAPVPRVCDPACGGGAFLVAVARHLRAAGAAPEAVLAGLVGVDRDPVAVEVAEAALWLLAAEWGGAGPGRPTLIGADALTFDWTSLGVDSVDVLIGNPPFLGQLRSDTARSRSEAARLKERFGLGGYADTAAAFLLLGLELVRPGGRLCLILPESFAASRDTAVARKSVAADGDLVALWRGEGVFSANVRVIAPVIQRTERMDERGRPATVRRFVGLDFEEIPPVPIDTPAEHTWSVLLEADERMWAGAARLLAAASGRRPAAPRGVLADHCNATADFRDQFYGLQPFVVDAPGADESKPCDAMRTGDGAAVRLITSGLIDPGISWWGRRPVRFAGSRFAAPVVDMTELSASPLARWAATRLVPKVLLATQTRVLEAVVDEEGCWLPSVPVITVCCERLWHLAAALNSPVLAAVGRRRHAGAALSSDALKLSARQVMALPAPSSADAWDVAAEEMRSASTAGDRGEWLARLVSTARHMCAAYGISGDEQSELMAWWETRLPRRQPWDALTASG